MAERKRKAEQLANAEHTWRDEGSKTSQNVRKGGNGKAGINACTVHDFAIALLAFQQNLADSDLDKAAVAKMLEPAKFAPKQLATEHDDLSSEDIPSMEEVSPDELKIMLKKYLGIEVSKTGASRKNIKNLREATQAELNGRPSWADLREALIDVSIQFSIIVLLPALVVVFVASYGQMIYSTGQGAANNALTMTEFLLTPHRIKGLDAEKPTGMWTLDNDSGEGRGSYAWAYSMYFAAAFYAGGFILRLSHSYLEPGKSVFRTIFWKIMAVVLTVFVWAFCIWVSLAAIWLMFAAILNPEANLVKGVILVTVVTVVSKLASRLYALKGKVIAAVFNRLNELLNGKVKVFLDNNPDVAANVAESADGRSADDIPMEEIFAILDNNNSNTLTFDEFNDLFNMLEMNIPLHEQQRMFEFADVNGNGTIDMAEFEMAWQYLKEDVCDKMIRQLGLADGDIFRNVAALLLLFVICIPLFLMMIALWDNSSSFVSVIHSLFVGSTGIFANSKKAKAEADDGKVNGMTSALDSAMQSLGENSKHAITTAATGGTAEAVGSAFGFTEAADQVAF